MVAAPRHNYGEHSIDWMRWSQHHVATMVKIPLTGCDGRSTTSQLWWTFHWLDAMVAAPRHNYGEHSIDWMRWSQHHVTTMVNIPLTGCDVSGRSITSQLWWTFHWLDAMVAAPRHNYGEHSIDWMRWSQHHVTTMVNIPLTGCDGRSTTSQLWWRFHWLDAMRLIAAPRHNYGEDSIDWMRWSQHHVTTMVNIPLTGCDGRSTTSQLWWTFHWLDAMVAAPRHNYGEHSIDWMRWSQHHVTTMVNIPLTGWWSQHHVTTMVNIPLTGCDGRSTTSQLWWTFHWLDAMQHHVATMVNIPLTGCDASGRSTTNIDLRVSYTNKYIYINKPVYNKNMHQKICLAHLFSALHIAMMATNFLNKSFLNIKQLLFLMRVKQKWWHFERCFVKVESRPCWWCWSPVW